MEGYHASPGPALSSLENQLVLAQATQVGGDFHLQ
jgi:hypothetical protein